MTNNSPQKERKEWAPHPDQLEFIKNKYAVFNNPPHTYTKTRLIEMFKITDILFMRLIAKHKIKPKKKGKGYVKDFSKYKRVPVPCSSGKNTHILVHPDRDSEEARLNYIERHGLANVKIKLEENE